MSSGVSAPELTSQLGEADAMRPRPLLARLDLELDALTAGQAVEVDNVVQTAAVEEVVPTVLRRDEPETPVLDQLLDRALGHRMLPLLETNQDRRVAYSRR